MKIQNLIFPKEEICTKKKLYVRLGTKAQLSMDRQEIRFQKYGTACFDTYFNSFSAEKWFRYTDVKRVSLVLYLKGSFLLTILHKERVYPNRVNETILQEVEVNCSEKEEYVVPIQTDLRNGMYTFSLQALESDSVYYGGYYDAEVEKKNPVNLGIVICTFQREKFILKNLESIRQGILENSACEMKENLEIFISDNAKTLNQNELESEKIHIFPNRNVGGAGGFTRGLMEVLEQNQKGKRRITNVLLMDDDVCIETEAIYRTFTLLSVLKEAYQSSFIGGAMLRLDFPEIQVEAGAAWNGGKLISRKGNIDLSSCEACLFNEIEEYYEFQAWWYCTIPMDVVREDNLPLPIFIRGDDVEYGLRNMKHLILMNGICLWHEPFERKYASSMFYYILRNRLIDNAVRGISYTQKEMYQELKRQMTAETLMFRYKNAHLLMDGVEDFLRGVDWFLKMDGEKKHQEIMGKSYRLKEDGEDLMDYGIYEFERNRTENRGQQIKRTLSLNGLLLTPNHNTIVPVNEARVLNFHRVNKVFYYDYYSRKGFYSKCDKKEIANCFRRLRKIRKISLHRYNKCVKEFFERQKEFTNIAFWKKYLGIESK